MASVSVHRVVTALAQTTVPPVVALAVPNLITSYEVASETAVQDRFTVDEFGACRAAVGGSGVARLAEAAAAAPAPVADHAACATAPAAMTSTIANATAPAPQTGRIRNDAD